VHRPADLRGVGALAQVTVHAQAHRAHHQVAVARAGEHQHAQAAVALQQHPGQVHPGRVAAAQVDVDDHQVGRAAVGDDQRVARGRRLADHRQLRVGGEQLAQPEPHDRLGVHDQQARGAAGGRRDPRHRVQRSWTSVQNCVRGHGRPPRGIDGRAGRRLGAGTLPERCTRDTRLATSGAVGNDVPMLGR